MVTFNINLELSADTGWTPDDVAVALGELAAEYKLELDGVVAQILPLVVVNHCLADSAG